MSLSGTSTDDSRIDDSGDRLAEIRARHERDHSRYPFGQMHSDRGWLLARLDAHTLEAEQIRQRYDNIQFACQELVRHAYNRGACQIVKHDERKIIALVVQFDSFSGEDYARFAHTANEDFRKIAYGSGYQPRAFDSAASGPWSDPK